MRNTMYFDFVCTVPISSHEIAGAQTKSNANFLVAMRLGDTPVLIPNTMVKT